MEQGGGNSHLSSTVSAPCRWRRRTPPGREARQGGRDGREDGADEQRPSQPAHRQLHLKHLDLSDPRLKFRWCRQAPSPPSSCPPCRRPSHASIWYTKTLLARSTSTINPANSRNQTARHIVKRPVCFSTQQAGFERPAVSGGGGEPGRPSPRMVPENAMIWSPRLARPSPSPARHPQTQRALAQGHKQSAEPHSSRIERHAARGGGRGGGDGGAEEERRRLDGEKQIGPWGAEKHRLAPPRRRRVPRSALPARAPSRRVTSCELQLADAPDLGRYCPSSACIPDHL
jgi:hypothetical protein